MRRVHCFDCYVYCFLSRNTFLWRRAEAATPFLPDLISQSSSSFCLAGACQKLEMGKRKEKREGVAAASSSLRRYPSSTARGEIRQACEIKMMRFWGKCFCLVNFFSSGGASQARGLENITAGIWRRGGKATSSPLPLSSPPLLNPA